MAPLTLATLEPIYPTLHAPTQGSDVFDNSRAHAHCTECSICGAGWDRKVARELPADRPQAPDA